MRQRVLALLLLWPSFAWADKAIPPSPSSYIHNEGVVSPGEEQRLSQNLAAFEQRTGHQFAVALFQSLDSESLEDYSNKVFRAWKIGGKKGDDGLLFCLYKGDRRWRVEVGYGLEGTMTDLEAAEIARLGIPHFKDGDFDGGVQTVVDALAAKLEGKEVPRSNDDDPWELYRFLFFFLLTILMIFLRHRPGFRSYSSGYGGFSGSDWSSGGGGGGGFSGGGGSSGGGGASGGW
jgi:uncharacterized protein